MSCTCPCISKGSTPHPTPILPPSQQHINAQSQQHVIFFIFPFLYLYIFLQDAGSVQCTHSHQNHCQNDVIFKRIFKCHLPHPATFTSYSHPRPKGSREPHPIYILLESPSQNKKKTARQKMTAGGSRGCRMQPKNAPASYEFRMQIFLHPSDFWD